MSIQRFVSLAAFGAAILLPCAHAVAKSGQWHFVVTNKTSSSISKLQVSIDKQEWGDFDIGSGIAAGATETLVWDSSTDDEPCEQWIRAKFRDGSSSPPSKQDFCQDLDTPIEFTE
ncbi:hypothetical protein [Dokdonella sp.]|uniref:hypothetical protein n=1 Tax=Dokdonella sp. TaxID=2291710 RepID=UPI00260AD77C|nr:hypothetical protein [Dokdonella sp.]